MPRQWACIQEGRRTELTRAFIGISYPVIQKVSLLCKKKKNWTNRLVRIWPFRFDEVHLDPVFITDLSKKARWQRFKLLLWENHRNHKATEQQRAGWESWDQSFSWLSSTSESAHRSCPDARVGSWWPLHGSQFPLHKGTDSLTRPRPWTSGQDVRRKQSRPYS